MPEEPLIRRMSAYLCHSASRDNAKAMVMKRDPLPQEARDLRVDDLASSGANTVSMLPRHFGARLLHELRAALPPTIFFFVGFNFIILTTNLC